MSLETALETFGIKLSVIRAGSHKTFCPKCSHTRTKNTSDTPLSVKVEENLQSAVWNCHHCGYKGGTNLRRKFNNDGNDYPTTSQRERDKRRDRDRARRQALRRDWY